VKVAVVVRLGTMVGVAVESNETFSPHADRMHETNKNIKILLGKFLPGNVVEGSDIKK